MSSKVADWTRDQHWLVRKIALRVAVSEYEAMRNLGFTAEQAAEHANRIAIDVRGIAECHR